MYYCSNHVFFFILSSQKYLENVIKIMQSRFVFSYCSLSQKYLICAFKIMQNLVAFIYNCYAILTRLQQILNQFILKDEKRLLTSFNAIPLCCKVGTCLYRGFWVSENVWFLNIIGYFEIKFKTFYMVVYWKWIIQWTLNLNCCHSIPSSISPCSYYFMFILLL